MVRVRVLNLVDNISIISGMGNKDVWGMHWYTQVWGYEEEIIRWHKRDGYEAGHSSISERGES